MANRQLTPAQDEYARRGQKPKAGFQSTGLGVEEQYDPAELEREIGAEPPKTDIAGRADWGRRKRAWLAVPRKPRPSPSPSPSLPPKPQMAEGGVVPPVPGGMGITAGEGGEPEVVIPMSKLVRIVGEETAMKIASAVGGGMGPGMGVMEASANRLRGQMAPPDEESPEEDMAEPSEEPGEPPFPMKRR